MLLKGFLCHIYEAMVSLEESCYSNWYTWAACDLVPVVSWQKKAVSGGYVRSLHSCMPKQRPFFVVRCDKLNRWVVVGPAIVSWVDVLSIVRGNNCEVLVASVYAHHVLHWVGMRSCECAEAVPVGDNTYIHKIIHQARKFNVILKYPGWVFERVVVMVRPVFHLKFFKEISES